MTPALVLKDVSAAYRNSARPVVDNANLQLETGELLAILGPSGCGKTTLLRVISGLMAASGGTIELGGTTVFSATTNIPPERRRIGLVPQDAALFPHLSVAQNVAFGLGKHPDKAARVAEMLELVDVAGLADRKPAQLSGGQAQRVALARALAPNPALVLLDEPFAALDAALRTRLRTDIADILAAADASAILVTHDQDEALSMAHRVAVMNGGVIAQCGTPSEVYNAPASEWVAHFLGTCTVLDDGAVVRPEQVSLRPATEAGDFTATIRTVEFLGHSTMYVVERGDGVRLSSRCLGAPRWQPGDTVAVHLSPDLHRLT